MSLKTCIGWWLSRDHGENSNFSNFGQKLSLTFEEASNQHVLPPATSGKPHGKRKVVSVQTTLYLLSHKLSPESNLKVCGEPLLFPTTVAVKAATEGLCASEPFALSGWAEGRWAQSEGGCESAQSFAVSVLLKTREDLFEGEEVGPAGGAASCGDQFVFGPITSLSVAWCWLIGQCFEFKQCSFCYFYFPLQNASVINILQHTLCFLVLFAFFFPPHWKLIKSIKPRLGMFCLSFFSITL